MPQTVDLVGTPRASVVPYRATVATPFVVVDGDAAAGSKALLGSADAITEQARLDIDSGEVARTLFVHAEQGHTSHAWSAMVVIDPGDDAAAADALNNASPGVRVVLPGASRQFNLASGALSVYVIGRPSVGATSTACKGRIWLEVQSHA